VKTIFCLFNSYGEAKTAVNRLLEQGFKTAEMNAIFRAKNAREEMDINWAKAGVQVTDKVGKRTLHGLDRLIGSQRPVALPDVGQVYAAGEMGTIVATAAMSLRPAERGLKPALMGFNVPEEEADAYTLGIQEGGLLFWIRTCGVGAPEVVSTLHHQQNAIIASHAN
jgi:hypothetical protein